METNLRTERRKIWDLISSWGIVLTPMQHDALKEMIEEYIRVSVEFRKEEKQMLVAALARAREMRRPQKHKKQTM